MKCLRVFVLAIVLLAAPSYGQQQGFFGFIQNFFRRTSVNSAAAVGASSSSTSSNSVASVTTTRTVTITQIELSTVTSLVEVPVTETATEFFTIQETLTERLIATMTTTRKMTATATAIVTTCPPPEPLRRTWKEIPNRIDQLYPSGIAP